MKIIHTADLHIGKRVNEFNMIDDQRHVLNQILKIIDEQLPDVFIVSGDVYDKSIPTAEAVELFDDFLTELAAKKLLVLVISGNHDSPERLNFGGRIMGKSGIKIASIFSGDITTITLTDLWGDIDFYLLPFIKPSLVRRYYLNTLIDTYEDAMRAVIGSADIDINKRNVLVAHQFVTAAGAEPLRCESESVAVGGVDNIDCSVFDSFDYVALGHMHRSQWIGRPTVRYAGSPIKYSFSEAAFAKSLTIIEIREKGNIEISSLPLFALHDMRCIKGPIDMLLSPRIIAAAPYDDYIKAILTDEGDILDAMGRLRNVYPNIMRLEFDNIRIKNQSNGGVADKIDEKSPLELFCQFYLLQQNIQPDPEKLTIISDMLQKLGGEC